MEYSFRKQEIGDSVRLLLDVDEGFVLDEFALHMISRNDPVHLVPVQRVQRDNRFYLQYDINDMKSLRHMLSGKQEKKDLIHIINSVIESFEEVEDYMLTEDILVLDMDYVYVDTDGQCMFLCVPCKWRNVEGQVIFLRTVAEHMLSCYTGTDTFLYDVINAFNRDGIKKLSDMKDILRKLDDTEKVRSVNSAPAMEENPEISQKEAVLVSHEQQRAAEEKKAVPVGFAIPRREKDTPPVGFAIPGQEAAAVNIPEKKENKKEKNKKEAKRETRKESAPKTGLKDKLFGKGTEKKGVLEEEEPLQKNYAASTVSGMYESYEETVLVTDDFAPMADMESTCMLGKAGLSGILIRKRTQEKFYIPAGKSVIGSGSSATHVINDNKAISRSHLILKLEEDRIMAIDNHSSNGTWVDGRKLVSGGTVFINDRALIKLADEEFLFLVSTS